MRKNTIEAFNAWKNGRHHRKSSTIWTSGGVLYSYGTEIARFSTATDKRAILNMSKYSVTTSCQQNGVQRLMNEVGITPVLCYDEAAYNKKRQSDF